VTLLLLQAALISGLVVQRARRRRAEDDARTAHNQLRLSYERIRELGGRLLSAQETERARIAREVHDDIGQQIALLLVDLQRLTNSHQDGHPDVPVLRALMDQADSIAKNANDLSHRLHPAKLRLIGLVPALTSLQHEMSHHNVKIAVSYEDVPPRVPHDVTLCLYRIAQEAVSNAIQHGSARHVSLRLIGSTATLTLIIVDDGSGFEVDAARPKGLGLISMNERVQYLGGTLTIESAAGTGTRVVAVVPLHGANAAKIVDARKRPAGASLPPRRSSTT
jgi:signal transduction histidine kinase